MNDEDEESNKERERERKRNFPEGRQRTDDSLLTYQADNYYLLQLTTIM